MARVFLSYASSDRAQARRLAEVLRRAGYSPILRVEEATGERLFDATKRVLEESDYVVVCLSQAALRSSWVQLEIAATVSGALEEEGRFFVVRWEAVGVPAALAQRPCVDLFPGEDAWHAGALQLVRVIERREEWRYGQDTLVRTQRLWMPSNLLPGPKHFVGRTAEMAAISEALTTGGPGTVLLHGPEGMGKTWLALEYAYRHRNEYLGGVWWIPASVSPAVTWARLFHVLREHGSPPIQAELRRVPESRPPSMLAAAVRAALATEPLPSLVILDAVGGRDWTQDLPGGAVRTLLTARERFHDSAVEVGALPADDALALADRVFGRKLSEEEARARKRVVLKLLAGHPAAIALAASLIDYERHVAGRVTLTGTPENRALKSAWKEGWRRYERRLAVETDSHPSRRGASSSEAVLDACVGLSIRGCSPEAHRFLRAYALFAPDQPSPIFIWLPTLAGLGETEDVHSQAERLRFELMDLGLLRRGRRGDFRWHEDDFLPRFVRERALAHTEAEPWREIATRGLRALEHRLAKGPGLVHIDEDLAHIQALLEVTDGVGNDADWTDAATRSATCFLERDAPDVALKLLRRALDKASEHSPPDSQRMAAALLGLSQVSLRLGQLEEARHHLERAVRLLVPAREDAEPGLVQRARAAAWLPGSEPLAHGLLHTLARVLEQEGDLAGAEWLLEQALLALRDRAGRPMDPDTAVELGALRLRLGDAVGAVRLLEFTLAELEPRQDMPRERLVPVMVTLAAALRGTGDVARAEALARRVREAQATREDLDSAVDPLMPAAAGTKGSVPAPVRSEELRALTRRAEEEEDLAKAARTALLRVDVEGRQGAWARAREAADEALQLARRAGEDALVAEAYRLRADACLHGSLYEDAQLGYEEAIRRYALLGHERMEAQSRMLLVALLLQLRRLERVAEHVDWLRRYAARGAATEDEQGELRALLRLADTLPGQGTGGKDPLQ